MTPDQTYLASRAAVEREAASNCTNEAARKAHLELAARYDDLASSMAAHTTKLGLSDSQSSLN